MTRREPESVEEILARFGHDISGMNLNDLRQLTEQVLARGRDRATTAIRPSRRRPRRGEVALYRVRVDLEHATPPIWRRLNVRSDLTLDVIHEALQVAFDWSDHHLHRFALGDGVFDSQAELFLCPFDVEEGEDNGVPAKDVRLDETLSEPGDVLRYCYDYGDNWNLKIRLEEVLDPDAEAPPMICLSGRRAAPPRTAVAFAMPTSSRTCWMPARFNLDEINDALKHQFT